MRRIATPLGVFAAALVALLVPALAGAAFGPSFSFGGGGTGDGFFNHPQSVSVNGGNGDVYVTDTGNARIQQFQANGTFIRTFASLASGFSPQDVAVAPNGNVYVASPTRVDAFTSAGVPLPLNSWTVDYPAYGIAVDDNGNVHVGDVTNSVIHKYGPSGNALFNYSGPGSDDGKLQQPRGLALGPSNRIYVADPSNGRVESFRASDGVFQAKFVTPSYTVIAGGLTFSGQVRPQDVGVDTTGRVFVPDSGTHSNLLAVLASDGTVQQIFGSPDSDLFNACQLRGPWGAAPSPSGRLYVVSTGEHRIRVFNETSTACPAPDFGSGGGVSGNNSTPAAIPLGPDHRKPKIKFSGFPRGLCARHNFAFKVRLRDDVQIQRFTLFVNREKVASNEIGRPDFIFKVNVPVVKVARQIPRGLAGRVLIGVRVADASGKKAKAKRDFLICGTK